MSNISVSRKNTPHYHWGKGCEGWRFKQSGNFSLIVETMPPGTSEKKHYHQQTEQFFYCLSGTLCIQFNGYECIISEHEGCNVPIGIAHTVKNTTNRAVQFLVISSPIVSDDRIELEEHSNE